MSGGRKHKRRWVDLEYWAGVQESGGELLLSLEASASFLGPSLPPPAPQLLSSQTWLAAWGEMVR